MSFLLAVLFRGAAVSLVGCVLLVLLRRATAATRHAVCVVCMGSMLALPLGLAYAPKREVAVRSAAVAHVWAPSLSSAPVPSNVSAASDPGAPVSAPSVSPAELLLGIWALGAVALGARLSAGWWWAWRLVRLSRPYADSHGEVEVRTSAETEVPLAVWAGRSVILLPETHPAWTEERRTAVLMHEAAHVRRGDWAMLFLSRLSLVLHWPNPFAWILTNAARRAAEDAADDAVLRSGFAPADYADHLLAIAQGAFRPALALPMAQRPDVYRRIHQVLNSRRSRGSVSVATLVVASVLIGAAFVPAVGLVAAQRLPKGSAMRAVLGGVADPQSYAYDIQQGWTKPGTSSNGFVGTLADGTKAQVVQISMQTPQGVVAWRPDGTPIPKGQIRPVEHLGGHYRSVLVRYAKRTASPEGGLGSGPSSSGQPSRLGFNSSRNQPGPKPKQWESYQFIEVPLEDGDRASFTFGLTNEPWHLFAVPNRPWQFFERLAGSHFGEIRNIAVSRRTATPMLRGKDGVFLKDAQGQPVLGRVPATAVSFLSPPDGKTYVARVTANLRNGNSVKSFWNDSGRQGDQPRYRFYFRVAPDAIKSFQVETRGYRHVEFLDVRLKPNK